MKTIISKSIALIRRLGSRFTARDKMAAFTLTEILIVVVILGILESIQIPNFTNANKPTPWAKAGETEVAFIIPAPIDKGSADPNTVGVIDLATGVNLCKSVIAESRGRQTKVICTTDPLEAGTGLLVRFVGVTAENGTRDVEPLEFTAVVNPPGQPTKTDPEVCDDGEDNDGDGATDCADDDCGRHPVCAPEEVICDDEIDNDGDGDTDCDDADCARDFACTCGNGELDDGEICDTSSGRITCGEFEVCTEECICE